MEPIRIKNKYLVLYLIILVFNYSCSTDSDILYESLSQEELGIVEVLESNQKSTDDSTSDNSGESTSNNEDVKTVVIPTINDAYIQGNTGYDQSIVRLQEDWRTTYLMFDLSVIDGTIESVSLEFTIQSDPGNGTILINRGSASDWKEENLTPYNAPLEEALIGSINNTFPIGATAKIDINSQQLTSDKITLIIKQQSGDDLAFASKEHPSSEGPKLIVNYIGTLGPSAFPEEENQDNEPSPDYGPLKAFPTAFGAGAFTSGARGASNANVYTVTNLNDSGPGSFRDALSQGNRYIVFAVSGTIELTSSLKISNVDNITIGGQTAPAGGVIITGEEIVFTECDNWIMRFLRFRPNWDHSGNVDAVSWVRCKNIIVDHVSVSWGGDEAMSFVGANSDKITMQRTLVGESKTGTIMGNSNYANNGSQPTGDYSLLDCMYYNVSHRFPVGVTNDRMDVINNVVHNWNYRLISLNAQSNIKLNNINNYYQKGCLSNNALDHHYVNRLDYDPNYMQQVYTSGNIISSDFTDPNADNKLLWDYWSSAKPPKAALDQVDAEYFVNSPFPLLGDQSYVIKTAEHAFQDVVNNVGANKIIQADGNVVINIDQIDAVYLSNTSANICSGYQYPDSYINQSSYINFHSQVSNIPWNTHASNYDSDKDGMPDIWETLKGYNPTVQDHNLDLDGNGYTNLEEFLNLVDF